MNRFCVLQEAVEVSVLVLVCEKKPRIESRWPPTLAVIAILRKICRISVISRGVEHVAELCRGLRDWSV